MSLLALFSFILTLTIQTAKPANAEGGYTWTKQESAGVHKWSSITSSTDGIKLAATEGFKLLVGSGTAGYIYTSVDSGVTWVERDNAGSHMWSSISSSADGTKLAAVATFDDPEAGILGSIYTSTDAGVTWSKQDGAGSRFWSSISSSADGTKLAAVAAYDDPEAGILGPVYTSVDSGVTWVERDNAGSHMWLSISSSADGTKLAAAAASGDIETGTLGSIYTSSDSGVTWVERDNAGSHFWSSITSSADGSKLTAIAAADDVEAGTAGSIYTSSDSGVTWSKQDGAGSHFWLSITSSADGSKLAAAAAYDDIETETLGSIYTSTDSGATWSKQISAGSHMWSSITSNADGSKLATGFMYDDLETHAPGSIYTAYNPALVQQSATATFPNSTDAKSITLILPSGTALVSHAATAESSLTAQDADRDYPLGLVNFSLSVPQASTQNITLTFETDLKPPDVVARKYNSISKQYADIAEAVITEDTVAGQHVLVLSYQITDGGTLDEDGVANGEIIDPVGLATVANATEVFGGANTPSELANTGASQVNYMVLFALCSIAGGLIMSSRRFTFFRLR